MLYNKGHPQSFLGFEEEEFLAFFLYIGMEKKGKKKVQGVPQIQVAVFPRHQEEEETDKTK